MALTQRIAITPDAQLVCQVSARGDGGAIQLRFRQGDDEWLAQGWLDIAPSAEWQRHRLLVQVPPVMDEAELRLRSVGLTWFDQAQVSIAGAGQSGPNLLLNAGFEQDGCVEAALTWWQTEVLDEGALPVFDVEASLGLSYVNLADMLSGRYQAIRQRAARLGDRCALQPDMTSWLLARGPEFERLGGLAARERLYQLAVELAPNCPQPCAALAALYQSHQAFWRAAEMYQKAAELAGETDTAGRWYFEAGFLHVRHTGDMERAIFALQRAEQIHGWASDWYAGAASLNLGIALEASGRFDQAAAAYQRVLECRACQYHHSSARSRLDELNATRN